MEVVRVFPLVSLILYSFFLSLLFLNCLSKKLRKFSYNLSVNKSPTSLILLSKLSGVKLTLKLSLELLVKA